SSLTAASLLSCLSHSFLLPQPRNPLVSHPTIAAISLLPSLLSLSLLSRSFSPLLSASSETRRKKKKTIHFLFYFQKNESLTLSSTPPSSPLG
ncbi:unnamed protein product, partial [Linum tenue]